MIQRSLLCCYEKKSSYHTFLDFQIQHQLNAAPRQSVEQVFSVSKSDLSLLPIRNHNERTVRGYLFLQFILLILYLRIQDEISKDYTVEQLLLTLRKLKCKVFDDKIIPSELTKKQRIIFEDAEIIVPNFLGI